MDPDLLDIRDTDRGCRLRVRVRAGARADAVVSPHAGALKIAVSAPPERGKANDAVAALLARLLRVHHRRVAVVAGQRSHDKSVAIEGLSAAEVRMRIAHLREG
jgi:uncharacterized protein (TIGR00251 family)